MNFKKYFEQFSIEKMKTYRKKVDSGALYYRIVMKDMATDIRKYVYHDEIIVKPSVGQGNYADIPWICLLSTNASISPNAQKGIYIVLLFNKEGNAFYLALSQGITNFKNMRLKPKELKENIEKTVSYFQNEVPPELIVKYGFSKDKIDLGTGISSLAKGYIQTTIIAKKYEIETFDQDDFYRCLSMLVFEYDEIIAHIGTKTYDEVIALISPQNNIETIDQALEEIHNVLKKEFVKPREVSITPIKVERGSLRSNRYNLITQERVYKKIDYIEKAREQYQIGLKGEELALSIERERLTKLGLEPDQYIKWCSIESDGYGYDFESVDMINGKLIKMFVEVKSTKDIKDTSFFVSKNEVATSKKKKDKYRIFRIFDITSMTPKYYLADGELEENFYLDPITFSARYKYDIIQ